MMLELAAALSIYVSFALLYAADPERLPWGLAPGALWGLLARVAALGGVLLAVGLLSMSSLSDGSRAAVLVIISALMAITTVFILLLSLWPRGMWALALASPPLIATLVAIGAASS